MLEEVDLELVGVTKYLGNFLAVDNISVKLQRGQFLTLLGPSGCGKTTTLRMIAGFIEPTKGEIYIKGEKVNGRPPYLRNSAMVFQNYALFPHLNVYKNVAFGLSVRGMGEGRIAARVKEALGLVQLSGLGERFPSQLSGGQQQRVAFARAIVTE